MPSKEPEGIHRSMRAQNSHVISEALGLSTYKEIKCLAYNPQTNKDYSITFGKSPISGLDCMDVVDSDGKAVMSISYVIDRDPEKMLVEHLMVLPLRLELTEADLILSKREIYFL